MGEHRVVVGLGLGALRAAAVLASAGHRVTLLQEGPTPSGLEHPDMTIDTGRLRVPRGGRDVVEQVMGNLVELPEASRGVTSGGQRVSLPMNPLSVPLLLGGSSTPKAATAWVRRRGRNAAAVLVGGGQEERTYKDWVVRRMGAPAYRGLYSSYAERRWGLAGDTLSASIARVFHGCKDHADHCGVGGGPAQAIAHAQSCIEEAGGTIHTGVEVKRLRLKEGRLASVQLADSEYAVAGNLWVAREAPVVARWLGDDLDPAVAHDASCLLVRSGLQVALRGDVHGLPDELHVLDGQAPFFRVVRPYGMGDVAVFHALCPTGGVPPHHLVVDRFVTSANKLGVGRFDSEGACVQEVPGHHPIWSPVCHVRLRRVLQAWRAMGLVAVGRAGLFGFLDAAEEVFVAAQYLDGDDPDQREVQRAHVEPPPMVQDLGARITRFVER